MYLYAVDPVLNTVVDMDRLEKCVNIIFVTNWKLQLNVFRILQLKQHEIESKLDGSKVLAVVGGRSERNQHRTRRVLLSSLEVGVVVLGCVVFVGALATAICVICIRRRKRRYGLLKNF